MKKVLSCIIISCLATSAFAAEELFIPVYSTTSKSAVGTVHVTQTSFGLLFTPDLHGLKPGLHEFDIHENASCAQHGLAAGGDLDPNHTNKHLGPYNPDGHLGDLPTLYVASDGIANLPVLAPRILSISQIKNHSLVIEATSKHGEGSKVNDRVACGIISS